MIRTVLGDINKNELGKTLAHEHFILDLDWVRKDGISFISDVEEVIPEIEKAMAQGIEAAFEVSTIDMKRDVRKLKEISERTGLKIVCSTGFYLSEYHPDWMDNASKEEIADIYIKELLEGIDGSEIKAGLIAEIASSPKQFVGHEKKILQVLAEEGITIKSEEINDLFGQSLVIICRELKARYGLEKDAMQIRLLLVIRTLLMIMSIMSHYLNMV